MGPWPGWSTGCSTKPMDIPCCTVIPISTPARLRRGSPATNLSKTGAVHEKTSCAIEPLTYIIYIRQAGSAGAAAVGEANPAGGKVRIEFRQDGESLSPGLIIQTLDFFDGMDVVLHLTADYFYWMGEEWLKTMTVLDEDRKVYVCYAQNQCIGGMADELRH